MAEKKQKKTNKPDTEKTGWVDPKWKKKPEEDERMDGLGLSFEEAMKVLSNPKSQKNIN